MRVLMEIDIKNEYNIKDAPCPDLQLLFDIFFYLINNLEDII